MNPQTISNEVKPKDGFFKEIIKFTIIALIVIIPVHAYIAQPFIVDGASMDPAFATGQYLIVDRFTYNFVENPQRGDVIVFKYPNNPKTYYIKRVIGLPGETISMNTGIVSIINVQNPSGFILDEPYITKEHRTSDTFTITLGPREYFVMGDNRPASSDSRTWGTLDSKFIVGKPFARLLPFSKITLFPGR